MPRWDVKMKPSTRGTVPSHLDPSDILISMILIRFIFIQHTLIIVAYFFNVDHNVEVPFYILDIICAFFLVNFALYLSTLFIFVRMKFWLC